MKLDDERARRVSPLFWPLPRGRTLDAVVGGLELNGFKQQSQAIAQSWRQSAAQTRYEEIPGVTHFTIVEALSDPQSAMTARIATLARAVRP